MTNSTTTADEGAPAARRLRRDAERNRQRVLAAAREVFANRGLEATLDDVAHRAGVGVGTVYRRFPDKEALVDALFEQSTQDLVALAESCLAEPDSWAGLVRYFETTCEMHVSDRGLQAVMLGSAFGRDRVARARERLEPVVRRLVERAQRDGHLRQDASITDMPLLSLVVGTVADYAGQIRPDVWRRALVLLLDGLCVRRDAPSPISVAPLSQDDLESAMRQWPRSRH